MRVVITEKPSVARDLARVLGVRGKGKGYLYNDDLRIGWCFGHMAELQEPAHYNPEWRRWDPEALPMLPEQFELRVRAGAEEQVKVLRGLLQNPDVVEVINGCDAGREGELIFRYLMQVAGRGVPVKRLWVSSMTDQAINRAWGQLRPGADYDTLADAARCRGEADWLVGLNATRAMTCLVRSVGGGQLLSVGRVQTPTLAMIVRRDHEIETFEPEDYWQVKATVQVSEDADFQATWFQTGGVQSTEEDDDDDDKRSGPSPATRLPSLELATALAEATRGQPGRIVQAERKRKSEPPPLLYDLTALQRRANQRYGLSAQKTLDIAQALYERHKLITYPRTDARYLTEDQVAELPSIVRAVGGLTVYGPFAKAILEQPIAPGKRVVNAAEVGDHHAILPTDRTPSPSGLNADEKRIYDLVARRLLAVLSPNALFDTANIVVAVDSAGLPEGLNSPTTWRARGRMCVERGWQAVDPPKKRAERELPLVELDDTVSMAEAATKAGRTRPPPAHNDASILKAMESAGRELDDAQLKRAMRQHGLGTPATRANILATLERRGFVVRNGKALLSTERGRQLIAAVPIEELKSAELTGRWEARLSAIADGKDRRDDFMAAVRQRTEEVVRAILAADPPAAEDIPDDRPILGECPICGTPVREGKGAYSCSKGRQCSFVIFKTIAKRPISKRSVKQLLTEGKTPVLKNFKSKKGKMFETALKLNAEGRVEFDFPPRKPVDRNPDTAPDPAGLPCPRCRDGRVMRGRAGWGCDRWRAGCEWRRKDT